MKPTPLPARPWQKIGLDLFEFNSNQYLIAVDYYSRWIEVEKLHVANSRTVIEKLKEMFARWGLPEEIRSDNGPQFSSEEFSSFCKSNDIGLSSSSPYMAQTNGAAERAVQTAKRLLKSDDPTAALMEYRSTPLQTIGYSPSQLIMGRIIKTRLPRPDNALQPRWPDHQVVREKDSGAKQKNATNYNRIHGARELKPIPEGSHVRIRQEKKWSNPIAVGKQVSSRDYIIRNRRHL